MAGYFAVKPVFVVIIGLNITAPTQGLSFIVLPPALSYLQRTCGPSDVYVVFVTWRNTY